MRTFLIAAIAAIGLALWLNHLGKNLPTALPLGRRVPSAELLLLGAPDSSVDIRDLITRPTVIDVMASWCEPCKMTIAPLERLADSLGRDRLAIVYVAYDGPRDTLLLRWFFRDAKLPIMPPVYVPDGDGFRYRYLANGIPRSYLVTADGTLRWQGLSATLSGKGHMLLDSAGLAVVRSVLGT